MSDAILILGASARAAAASARRAGLRPFAIDLFADADTERICERVWRCPPDRYPEGLFELAKQAPPMPWMYTGGLENYPELVGELARERELWGNGPDKLVQVRDPLAVQATYQTRMYAIPETLPGTEPPPPDRMWVRKPLRGAGGGGVQLADSTNPCQSKHHVYQEYVPGEPISALFMAENRDLGKIAEYDRGWPHTLCIALFRQLIGTPWLNARGFQYAGNLGPFWLRRFGIPGAEASGVGDMNDERAQLAGVFGADFILTADKAHLIEINPRYPASAELADFAGYTTLNYLASCFAEPDALWKAKTFCEWPMVFGKAIYYAPHRIIFPTSGPWDDSLARAADVGHRSDFADIPHPGDVIERGHPVITILTDADTEAECIARLQSRAAELDRLFGHVPEPEGNP